MLASTTYLYGSAVVGILQVADSFALARRQGVPSGLLLAFALIEYVWAFVSWTMWTGGALLPAWLPLSFVGYVMVMVALSCVFVRRRSEKLRIPMPSVYAGGLFGVYFTIATLTHAATA